MRAIRWRGSALTGSPVSLMNADSHFQLFGLVPEFGLDMAGLERAYRELQAKVPPDRYASADAADRRAAMHGFGRIYAART